MSRFSNFRISKGGRLLADEWNYDRETETGEMDRGIDITNYILYHLEDECNLEDGLVFKDILLLMEKVNLYTFLSPLFTRGPWLKDLVKEGLTPAEDKKSSVETIKVGWAASVDDDYHNEGQDTLQSYVSVSGKIPEDDELYGLDFTPMNELVDCNIHLNRELVVYDERKDFWNKRRDYLSSLTEEERKGESLSSPLLKTNKDFTLLDILRGLFWEFSFHGGPEERKKQLLNLMDTINKIDSGEEELITWEDVKAKIDPKNNPLLKT